MSSVPIARLRIEVRARLLGSFIADVLVARYFNALSNVSSYSYPYTGEGVGYDDERDIEYGYIGGGFGICESYFTN